MTWMKLDDRILEHPKFIRAIRIGGSEALHLWLGLRAWCAQALSDGHVPEDMIEEVRGPRKGRERSLEALVEVGLVERTEVGWKLHDYSDWADSREDVLAARKKSAERQKASRRRRNGESQGTDHHESHGMSQRDAGVTSGVTHASVAPSVTHPPRARTETDTDTETLYPPVAPQGGQTANGDPWGLTPEPKPRGRGRARGVKTLLPEDWQPNDEHRAESGRVGVNCDDQAERMRDWARAKGERKADWDAAFRNWLRTAADRAGVRPPPVAGRRADGLDDIEVGS
jgi:hypothetical protein